MTGIRDCVVKQLNASGDKADSIRAARLKKKQKETLRLFDELERQYNDMGMNAEQARQKAADVLTAKVKRDRYAKKKMAVYNERVKQDVLADMKNFKTKAGERDPGEAMKRRIERVEKRENALRSQYHAAMGEFTRLYSVKKAGLVKPVKNEENILRELMGENTGDEAAKELAQGGREALQLSLKDGNAAGFTIADMEHYVPLHHDRGIMAREGKKAWVDFWLEHNDFGRSLHPETGLMVAPHKRREVLEQVYETISSEGANKIKPSMQGGGGSLASNMGAHRFLYPKDADALLRYRKEFTTDTVYETISNHLSMMAKNIALAEVMGPNPEGMRRFIRQVVLKDAATKGASGGDTLKQTNYAKKQMRRFDTLWDVYLGAGDADAGVFARAFADIRQLTGSAVLGNTALLAAPVDLFTTQHALYFNGLPSSGVLKRYMEVLVNQTEWKQIAAQTGYIADSAMAMFHSKTRLQGEMFGNQWSRRASDVMLRTFLLTPHTEAMRTAFTMEMMAGWANAAKDSFDALPDAMQNGFVRFGITPEDWDALRRTPQFTPKRGVNFLVPSHIRKRASTEAGLEQAKRVERKFQEMLFALRDEAVISPNIRTRATLVGQSKAGSLPGELLRSIASLKSFPATLMLMQQRALLDRGMKGGAAVYLASLMAGMTAMGALSVQMRDMASGRDPQDMTTANFWGRSFTAGGGAGVIPDLFFKNPNEYGQSAGETLAGPQVAFLGDALSLTLWNAVQAVQGEETNIAEEAVQFGRRYAPRPFYIRAVIDRVVFDLLQQMVDPRAYRNLRKREKNLLERTGQEVWWPYGKPLPERGPDIGAAFGE